MEIMADSILCSMGKRKKILKIKYTKDTPFPEARKSAETHASSVLLE